MNEQTAIIVSVFVSALTGDVVGYAFVKHGRFRIELLVLAALLSVSTICAIGILYQIVMGMHFSKAVAAIFLLMPFFLIVCVPATIISCVMAQLISISVRFHRSESGIRNG